MLRVTADSNIYISGLISGRGNPHEFLEMARRGKIRLAVSDAILDEVADVLGRKFSWPEADIAVARQEIERFAQKVTPKVALEVVRDDPDDNRIIECASAAASSFIVTGDHHLLKIGRFGNARILKVADFLDLMQGRER